MELTPSTATTTVTSTASGFEINGNAGSMNKTGKAYVAWAWDAGSSTVNNTDGSITTNVRNNPSAGFRLLVIQATPTIGATIGHGLNSKPEFFIFKIRTDTGSWFTYHKAYGAQKYLTLDRTHSAQANSYLNNTEPNSSVITLSNSYENNGLNQELICYAWTSVPG